MRKLLLAFVCLVPLALNAQAPVDSARAGYAKRLSELSAMYAENPRNVEALYNLALFYFDNGNHMHNLPVAMQYIMKAEERHIFLLSNDRNSEVIRLGKKGIDLMSIRNTRQAIADAARRRVSRYGNMDKLEVDIYQDVFGNDPEVVKMLRKRRFELAYNAHVEAGTPEAYYHFCVTFPGTSEAEQMEERLAGMAQSLFANVASEAQADSVAAAYAQSTSVARAAARCKSRLAYAEASRANTVAAFADYLRRYPAGDEQLQARERLDALLEAQYYTLATAREYADFADSNADNRLADSALAQIRHMITDGHDMTAAKLYVDRFKHDPSYGRIYNLYYSWFAAEGNRSPLIRFDEDNPDFPTPMALESDMDKARRVDMLNLMDNFSEYMFETYAHEIRQNMEKRISFVMLQRTLQRLLVAKNYNAAKVRALQFELCFESVCVEEYAELLEILSQQVKRRKTVAEYADDDDILNPSLNQADGCLYFTRRDKNGMTRVCFAEAAKTGWGKPKTVAFNNVDNKDLSIFGFFDSGKKMLLGKDGDIWIAEREASGWRVSDIPTYPVNTDYIETDAYMLPDGSGILLASDRPGGYNMQHSGDWFHGDTALATDLYFIPYTEGGWGTPVNLGSGLNTSYCERSPLLSKNRKTLYYVTDSRGLGYGDIYVATRENVADWTSWSKPRNLGCEVNGPFAELSLSFADNERRILFASKTDGGGYACFSTPVAHDTVTSSDTYILDVRGLEGQLTRVRVADMGSQDVVRQTDYTDRSSSLGLSMNRGHNYAVLGDAGKRFVPAMVVSPEDTKPQRMRGYTFAELVAADRALPLPAVTFAPDKDILSPVARIQLAQLARFASHQPRCSIELIVNVDGRDDIRCFSLALARGNAVRDYLTACGLDASTITVSPYGNTNAKKGPAPELSVRFRERY